MYKKMKCGFTLAELMAVIIIVSLLAVLSAGYYRRAVEQSRFSEGLMAASAVAEAVNRAYLEQKMNGVATPTLPTINHLDISFLGSSSCNDIQCTTKYFHISVDSTNGLTTANRIDGIYPRSYSIQIQPHFAANHRDEISCFAMMNNSRGRDFCESMGYTQCDGNGLCTKPN